MSGGENGAVTRSLVTIDLGAVRHNARVLADKLEETELWAVVKADGYGHGAADVGRAALEGGATALCVATVAEGVALRAAVPADADPRARPLRGRGSRASPGTPRSS